MHTRQSILLLLVITAAAIAAELPKTPPGPHFPLTAADHKSAPTFDQGQPIIATSYFYWYDIDTKSHIINHDGTDALTTHPADVNSASYKSTSWHKQQLTDMIDAGIDCLMPVYWGVPGDYKAWSFAGLPPLVAAHTQLQNQNIEPPAIGMFYDTSILQWNTFNDGRSYHVDLTTDFGREWFYTAIRDFFSLIPPSKWARVDGQPIVFLYGANFAKAQDDRAIPHAKQRFKQDFGIDVFIVKNADWRGKADAEYSWGGAVNGPLIFRQTAAIGPGYDHSAVPNRTPLIVERREGRTYIDRWTKLMQLNPQHRPWLVHVETWNEWHEGTDIAHSAEYGRSYIVLTRHFADLWHGKTAVKLASGYIGADKIQWQSDKPQGIDIRPSEGDGVWTTAPSTDSRAVVSKANETTARYLYFNIDDAFAFDVYDSTVKVTVEYKDAGPSALRLEYDNTDQTQGSREGAFRPAQTVDIAATSKWKSADFTLEKCRFMNRCNGVDLRLAILGGNLELTVRSVVLEITQ